jgi:hypothetical protein
MATSNIATNILLPTKAPNLPISAAQYSQQYQDQLVNALRLYFNQLDTFSSQTIGVDNSQSVLMWMNGC